MRKEPTMQTLKKTLQRLIIYMSAVLFITSTATSQTEYKLIASDAAPWDLFGNSVSISGNLALVGASGFFQNVSGYAYVFKRTHTGWIEEAKLIASDAAVGDGFGLSAFIRGDLAVVGAPRKDFRTGSAYVFKRTNSGWVEEAKLTASDAAFVDYFGTSVSFDKDLVVVGSRAGAAYVFKRTDAGWIEEEKLLPSVQNTGALFGEKVSIRGDWVVVGATGDYNAGIPSGSAYVFKRTGSGWIEEAKLTASDASPNNKFGDAVSISERTILIGAPDDNHAGPRTGSAYVFKLTPSGWIEEAKLTASDADSLDFFAQSVSISGRIAVISATGDDDAGPNSGSAYMFKRTHRGWVEAAKLTASDAGPGRFFGRPAISGNLVLIGDPGDDDAAPNSGSAYIYEFFTDKLRKAETSTGSIPNKFALEQNYPNPFNPETEIRFQLPQAGTVVLRIFNTLGQEIRRLADEQYDAGSHTVRWDGKDNRGREVSSGIYLYQLQAGDFSQIKKMTLLR